MAEIQNIIELTFTEADGSAFAASALESATNAAESASNALRYANTAGDYAESASEFSESASNSAGAAQQFANTANDRMEGAESAAQQAETSATNAATYEQNAFANAQDAQFQANRAATASQTAVRNASDAAGYAANASSAANNASNSATSAASSATQATSAKDTVVASVTEAAGYASSADSSATQAAQSASTAQTQAQNAMTHASNAQTFANNAQTSATQAAASATTANDSAKLAVEVAESIPADYTTLSNDVDDLKSALDDAIEQFAVPTQEAVDNWLVAHPEATTTVQDNSLTTAKYQNESITDEKLSSTGVKRSKVGYNVFPQYRIAPTHVIDLPSITGYYPQGFAFDGTYYYVGYLDTATYHNGIIAKYDTNGNEITRSTDTYNHVNAIEIIGDKLYVASLGDIFVANKSTLAKESTISCRGGSGFVANVQFSGSYGGVSGNQSLQYVMLTSSKGMEVYYNGKKVDCIAIPSSPLTPQGGTGYNGYIYEVESVGSDIGTNGVVNIWDVQGNTCAQLSIELGGELEDVSIINNTMYMCVSQNGVPRIYSANISMLTPYLPVLNWYNCKGQRYQCDLTYSNSTQLTKITVPPIVDVFLAYAQPCQFDVITNAFFAKAGYNSSGFEITYFENNVTPASFIRLHYTRTGTQTYEMDSCSIVSLLDGTTTSAWINAFPKIDALFITTEFLTR